MINQTDVFGEITIKKVRGGNWDWRITRTEFGMRGRAKKISYKPHTKQNVSICEGRKYHLVYQNGNLVHADVEDTKTGIKNKIIDNGIVAPRLQGVYNRIKNSNITDVEKIMTLDASKSPNGDKV
jgi:hypothetical protein